MTPGLESSQFTVLLVDDEEPLRRYMARVMADEGYNVVMAADGLEALALVETSGRRIHLVITDILMPGMTGVELAGRIARQSSPPPVLFVSGGHDVSGLPGPILRKPFLPSDLTAVVHNLLDGGTERSQSDQGAKTARCTRRSAPSGLTF